MYKKVFLFPVLLLPVLSYGQIPARDPGLRGQLKRMVSTQWDDWMPNPHSHRVLFVRVPYNVYGWTYWRTGSRKGYYKGKDRRPMRIGGPFDTHLAAAFQYKSSTEKEYDSVKVSAKKALTTDVSMRGGVFDLPYKIYFKAKYIDLFATESRALKKLQYQYPKQWQKMLNEPKGTTKGLLEYFALTQDRIENIHKAYMDRGDRMILYFKILDELEEKVTFTLNYCRVNVEVANYPTKSQMRKAFKRGDVDYNASDKEIVRYILKNYDF